jgi:general secretion pathway protein M
MNPRDWYAGLAPRERQIVLGGGAVAAILVVIGLLWRLEVVTTRATDRVEGKREDLSWIEAVTPRLRSQPAARPGESLAIAIDRVAGESGLAATLAGIEPAQPGTVRVRFNAAPFDALVICLARLQQEIGASTEGADVTAAGAPGLVNATVVLRGH